jgi:hypothetical protein
MYVSHCMTVRHDSHWKNVFAWRPMDLGLCLIAIERLPLKTATGWRPLLNGHWMTAMCGGQWKTSIYGGHCMTASTWQLSMANTRWEPPSSSHIGWSSRSRYGMVLGVAWWALGFEHEAGEGVWLHALTSGVLPVFYLTSCNIRKMEH